MYSLNADNHILFKDRYQTDINCDKNKDYQSRYINYSDTSYRNSSDSYEKSVQNLRYVPLEIVNDVPVIYSL